MNVVPLLLLCSLCLVAGALVLFVWSSRQGDCQEADRLCLLPLDDDGHNAAANEPKPAANPDPTPRNNG